MRPRMAGSSLVATKHSFGFWRLSHWDAWWQACHQALMLSLPIHSDFDCRGFLGSLERDGGNKTAETRCLPTLRGHFGSYGWPCRCCGGSTPQVIVSLVTTHVTAAALVIVSSRRPQIILTHSHAVAHMTLGQAIASSDGWSRNTHVA